MHSSRSPEAPCCLGRCSHSRSPSQRFRSLALVRSSGRSSLAQVFRFCSNETSCKSYAHLCPWERSVQDRRRGQRGELAATRNNSDAPSTQPGGLAAQTSCSRFCFLTRGLSGSSFLRGFSRQRCDSHVSPTLWVGLLPPPVVLIKRRSAGRSVK